MGCQFLLQGIFLTQGSNLGVLHCGQFVAFTYFCSVNTSAMICLKQLIWYYWAQSWEEMPTVCSGLLPASSSTSLWTEIWAQILSATIHLDLSFLIPSCLPPFSFSLPLSSSSFLSQESSFLSQELDLSSYRSHLELAQTMWIPFLTAL